MSSFRPVLANKETNTPVSKHAERSGFTNVNSLRNLFLVRGRVLNR